MKYKLAGRASLANYDENAIRVGALVVSFEAFHRIVECQILLKQNWRDYVISGNNETVASTLPRLGN